MKRTNLVLDEILLKETLLYSQKTTYSDAVNEAMKEFCRIRKVMNLYQFRGTGIWTGNLSKMRDDKATQKKGNQKRK